MTGSLQTARLNSLGGHTDIATYRLNRPRGGGLQQTHTQAHTQMDIATVLGANLVKKKEGEKLCSQA